MLLAIGLGASACVGVIGIAAYLALRDGRKRDNSERESLYDLIQRVPLTQPLLIQPKIQFELPSGLNEAGIGTTESVAAVAPSEPVTQVQANTAVVEIAESMKRPPENSIMQTLQLPSLTDPKAPAIRLAQAIDSMATVTLRVVGPAGTFAAFALDQNELAHPDMPATPTGNTVIVPSGQTHQIRLRPREVIYAKGSQPGVIATATSAEAGGRIYD